MFWVFDHQTPSLRQPSQGWSNPDLCPSGPHLHGSPLRIQSHLESFSASLMFLMALLHSWPFTPRNLRVRCSDWNSTSTGSSLRSYTSLAYLALMRLLASSIWSSQGTVSSTRITCFVDSDVMCVNTTSGRSEVAEMCSGNLGCRPRSTRSFSPALTKVMDCLGLCCCLSASALRTRSWRQCSLNTFGQCGQHKCQTSALSSVVCQQTRKEVSSSDAEVSPYNRL